MQNSGNIKFIFMNKTNKKGYVFFSLSVVIDARITYLMHFTVGLS